MRFRKLLALAAVLAAGCGGGDDDGAVDATVVDAAPPDVFYAAPYVVPAFDKARITSIGGMPNFQQVNASIDVGAGPFASVKLVVDLSSTCYPFESWTQPPAGQNWPADCDAFDRNFEFTLDDPPGGPDAGVEAPAIEVLRAITPFGGPLHLEEDMTDIANGRPGAHRLRAYIATWSDGAGMVSGSAGGWNVSAHLEVVPGPAPRTVLAVIPLWNGSLTTAAGPDVSFQIPAGVHAGKIAYRTTGHGGGAVGAGCIGPAEEFCRRTHVAMLDGAELARVEPWRTDCATLCTLKHYGPVGGGFDYCMENPCGNVGSVRASRANWCPGSRTPPFEWSNEALGTPGAHSFRWDVSTLLAGGSWRTSALYFGYAQ
jgi:Peptide-N-glycosidase F, C terminal